MNRLIRTKGRPFIMALFVQHVVWPRKRWHDWVITWIYLGDDGLPHACRTVVLSMN